MSKKIMQFRYYGKDGGGKNYPEGIDDLNLSSGDIFYQHDCYPIIQLGIQSIPGQKFYLNGANTSIVIGSTGIYELDLEGYAEIKRLTFDYNDLQIINSNPNAYLIVDVICNKQEAKK